MSLTIERPTLVDVHDFQAREPAPSGEKPLFGESGPSFGDLLDIVNPLQHLPVVGTIYRALTGDELSDGARLAGRALFGGPIGLVAAMANLGVREALGRDLGEIAVATLTGEEAPLEAAVQVAASDAGAAEPAAPASAGAPAAAAQPEPAGAKAMPQLSAEAFDTLLRSVNQPTQSQAQAQVQATAPEKATTWPAAWTRPGLVADAPVTLPPAVRAATRMGLPTIGPAALDALAGGPAAIPAMAPSARQASLELHDALRAYAEQKGFAPGR